LEEGVGQVKREGGAVSILAGFGVWGAAEQKTDLTSVQISSYTLEIFYVTPRTYADYSGLLIERLLITALR
jgi:hypothetical protein